MRTKHLLAILCLLLLCSSCGRRLLSTRSTAPTVSSTQSSEHQTLKHDSTTTNSSFVEKLRLTPVEVGADRVPFVTQVEVNAATGKLKPATYTSRGRRATVSLTVDADGKVSGECGCDAEKAIIASKDRLLERQQQVSQVLADYRKQHASRTVEVPVPLPLAWYDKVARVLALLLLAGLVLAVVLFIEHRRAQRLISGSHDETTL